MNLVNVEFDLNLTLEENMVQILCIEHPLIFTSCIDSLWRQSSGEEGTWILSKKDKMLNISKMMECIFNPLSVDCNDKRVLNKLYQELLGIVQDQLVYEAAELNCRIINFIDGIIQRQSYGLDMKVELDLTGLMKLYDVRFETSDLLLTDKLITYIKIMHQVFHKEIFAFVNLKSYLNSDEMSHLYHAARYEKVYLFLIENHYKQKNEKCEKIKIIDSDMCIIDI